MEKLLLDTDMLSFYLKKVERVSKKAEVYLEEHKGFTMSVVTYYEVVRGLRYKKAIKQEERLASFWEKHTLLSVSKEVSDKAAALHATLKQKGVTIGDADILIASTALVHKLTLCTNNQKHFKHIEELRLVNWLSEEVYD